jgi:hypothetical protein
VLTWIKDAQGRKKATHIVSASLRPDGSREHRIDGKIKSSKEVKVKSDALSCIQWPVVRCFVVQAADQPQAGLVSSFLLYWDKSLLMSCSSECKEV